jgi:hypothetical protein
MAKKVTLSNRSQQLITNYLAMDNSKQSSLTHFSSSVDDSDLVEWLHGEIRTPVSASKQSNQEMEFTVAALRSELLHDLFSAMKGQESSPNPQEEHPSRIKKVKFALLAAAGTLLAACEGFDSITTMMSVFSLPSVLILLMGVSFSALSILVFYGFDLVQVSKNLGVTLRDAPKLLDVYLAQMNEIKAIRRQIATYCLSGLSTEELSHLEKTIHMLDIRFQAIIEASKQFDLALNSSKIRISKGLFAGISGLLFFGGGFFAGQSVAMFMLGLVITGGVTATFWPVVLFSVVVGLAAFSLYWYIEQVGLKQLISGWFGLDEEKIEKLCDKDILNKEANKLGNLKEQVKSTIALKCCVDELAPQQTSAAPSSLRQENSATNSGYELRSYSSSNKHRFYVPTSQAFPEAVEQNEHVTLCDSSQSNVKPRKRS